MESVSSALYGHPIERFGDSGPQGLSDGRCVGCEAVEAATQPPRRRTIWDASKVALRSPGYYLQVAGAVAGYINPAQLTPLGLGLLSYGAAVGLVRRSQRRGPAVGPPDQVRGLRAPALSGVASVMGAGLLMGALVRRFPWAAGAAVAGLLLGAAVGDRLGADETDGKAPLI
ncbi:MAG: hypothetical protein IPK13_19930 [Deltaproteobacteria bacterium]|nr:hypothetical protein [Deltaproteobacteria bacterium]